MVFFFNDTATTEIYTLSLHDALPISSHWTANVARSLMAWIFSGSVSIANTSHPSLTSVSADPEKIQDRKSTRLNSSHVRISYAVFWLKKKTLPNAEARPPRDRGGGAF